MILSPEIASDLRNGAVFTVSGECIGIRRVRRIWFNLASGCYVADVGSCFMFTDEPDHPWRVVPNTAPCFRANAAERVRSATPAPAESGSPVRKF